MTALRDRIARPGPKKMLSIDGGGIRGVMALEILGRIEDELRARTGRTDYVLADYFDAIAGTSTGAIVAAGLSLGMSVDQLMQFYVENGRAMFEKASLLHRLSFRFRDEPLALKLREVFGTRTLGSPDLRTLFMLVMRNASTDSPWPITNNPYAHYNRADHHACNLHLPLWQLVRASSAAPTYFPPEVMSVGDQKFIFVDGGVTMYNNPAFQLFLMMTVDRFWRTAPPELANGWDTGSDKLLLVSVGTGTSSGANQRLETDDMNLLFNASRIPAALMFSASIEQDMLCRVFGDCQAGDPIDREVGTLIGSPGPSNGKMFRYARYNAELSDGGLQAIGCCDLDPAKVQRLDSVEAIPHLRQIGRAVAASKVHPSHWDLDVFTP